MKNITRNNNTEYDNKDSSTRSTRNKKQKE